MDLLQVVPKVLQGSRAPAGRLEHRVDRADIPALDLDGVSGSTRSPYSATDLIALVDSSSVLT